MNGSLVSDLSPLCSLDLRRLKSTRMLSRFLSQSDIVRCIRIVRPLLEIVAGDRFTHQSPIVYHWWASITYSSLYALPSDSVIRLPGLWKPIDMLLRPVHAGKASEKKGIRPCDVLGSSWERFQSDSAFSSCLSSENYCEFHIRARDR